MKKNTIIWIGVGVIALLAIPVILLANRKKGKKEDEPEEKPKKNKGSVIVGKVLDEADYIKQTSSFGPFGKLGADLSSYIASLPTYQVVTSGDELNIREKPNAQSAIIGKLKNGEKVKGSVPKNGWISIFKGKGGNVNAKFMKKISEGAAVVK